MELVFGPTEDTLQVFTLHEHAVVCRITRLEHTLATILSQHPYPPIVARYLSELCVITALLSSLLKEPGKVTVQIQSKAKIPLIVVSATDKGNLRGFARWEPECEDPAQDLPFSALFGSDSLIVVTYHYQSHTEPSQGIITLSEPSFAASFTRYFQQSEQILSFVLLASDMSKPISAGLLVQALPDKQQDALEKIWPEVLATSKTLPGEALLDPYLPFTELLWQYYQQHEPSILRTTHIQHACECSRERALAVVKMLTPEERASYQQEGGIEISCEFCNKKEVFSLND